MTPEQFQNKWKKEFENGTIILNPSSNYCFGIPISVLVSYPNNMELYFVKNDLRKMGYFKYGNTTWLPMCEEYKNRSEYEIYRESVRPF
jgi:hypothetical protein